MPLKRDWYERFQEKIQIDDESGCWLWIGYLLPGGYATISFQGKKQYAHRVAYSQFVGPIPEGMVLDHLCRIRNCCNPAHLEPVTQAENSRRAIWGPPRPNQVRDQCRKGHPYTEENTLPDNGDGRKCRTCYLESKRRAYLRKQSGKS